MFNFFARLFVAKKINSAFPEFQEALHASCGKSMPHLAMVEFKKFKKSGKLPEFIIDFRQAKDARRREKQKAHERYRVLRRAE